VVHDEPVPPRQLQSRTPRDLETITLKCLQKEASRRYASAAKLAEDLRRFQAGEPIRARPAGLFRRGVERGRREPAAAEGVVDVLGIFAVGATVSTVLAIRESEARSRADQDAWNAKQSEQKAREQKEKARFNQYVAQMNLVQREYEAKNDARVRELLEAQV